MRYGICGGPATGLLAAEAGFDYFEWSVGEFLRPSAPEATFREALKAVQAVPIPCPVVNCFVPGEYKITGPDVDPAALLTYVSRVFERAQQAGVRTIVFGSGGARRVPAGFDPQRAHSQLVRFALLAATEAGRFGVTLVLEPLNRDECNVLNGVAECADLVREVDSPSFRLLVDAYHLLRDGDSLDDVRANADLLKHAHIATCENRLSPGAEPCEFGPFFKALRCGGYDGSISIEGKLPDGRASLATALSTMRSCDETFEQAHQALI